MSSEPITDFIENAKTIRWILIEIEWAAVDGCTGIIIDTEPPSVIKDLGYHVNKLEEGKWEIGFSKYNDPILENVQSEYLPQHMVSLFNGFKKIRKFVKLFLEEAMVAAATGYASYSKDIPDDMDIEKLNKYVDEYYLVQSLNVDEDFRTITCYWDKIFSFTKSSDEENSQQ